MEAGVRKVKRKNRAEDDFDEGNADHAPLDEKERRSTLRGSLSARVQHAAVKEMCDIAVDDGNRMSFYGVLAVTLHCMTIMLDAALTLDQQRTLLPDLTDGNVWKAFFFYAAQYGKNNVSTAKWLSDDVRTRFYVVLETHFVPADFNLVASHDNNFFRYLGDLEATAHKVFSKKKTIQAHVVRYLMSKYALPSKRCAHVIAERVLALEPLGFTRIHRQTLDYCGGLPALRDLIAVEVDIKNSRMGTDTEFGATSQGGLLYRMYMLAQLDTDVDNGLEHVKRFSLMPTHKAGGQVRFINLDAACMLSLLPCIRQDHPAFYASVKRKQKDAADHARALRELTAAHARAVEQAASDDTPLPVLDLSAAGPAPGTVVITDFFKCGKYQGRRATKGWVPTRVVGTNGVELHTTFERNVERSAKGRAKKSRTTENTVDNTRQIKDEAFWNPPLNPQIHAVEHPSQLAGADVGYHNLFTCYRELDDHDTHEVRTVTKRWYDDTSGRNLMRAAQKKLSARAEASGLLTAITAATTKTVALEGFLAALRARRASFDNLKTLYGSKRLRRLRAFCAGKEQAAIEELVDYITWGGTVTLAIGDCSKTTGIKGTSVGGPIKKINRLMVKKRLNVFMVNEAYTSKSSLCCWGSANACQRLTEDITTYKKGKYMEQPHKMPRSTHGVSCCTNCGTAWSRDVVGSRNILEVAWAQIIGAERPIRFTRQGYSTTADGDRYVTVPPTRTS